MPLFWSVERDRDAVVAICPEPLRAPGITRPAWMTHCAEAIREELRLLPAPAGTLLAATQTGDRGDVAWETSLLSHRGLPLAHVEEGLRFALLPAAERGVELRYRRAPVAAAEAAEPGAAIARLRVPLTPRYELEPGEPTWLAALPDGRDGLSLHAHFTEGAAEVHGSVELIEALLERARADLTPAGGALDLRAIELTFAPGDPALLAVELRAIPEPEPEPEPEVTEPTPA
jgi:hypothetical protein